MYDHSWEDDLRHYPNCLLLAAQPLIRTAMTLGQRCRAFLLLVCRRYEESWGDGSDSQDGKGEWAMGYDGVANESITYIACYSSIKFVIRGKWGKSGSRINVTTTKQ